MKLLLIELLQLLFLSAFPPAGLDSLSAKNNTAIIANNFISPVDIPLALSGNFGEPRKAHFHTGLDIKTNDREGYNVYAVGDGYVARIFVSPYGYGNALYIQHPNGYMTVYGHLQSFSPAIMQQLRQLQYAKKSFATDVSFSPNEISVKRGEVIAKSGNSGGSGGPHLHFEIRDAKDQPLNPLLFGYKIPDGIAPTIGVVKFYSQDNDRLSKKDFQTIAKTDGNNYQLKDTLLMLNADEIGIGVNTFDKMKNSTNVYGIFNLKLFDNDNLVYEYQLDKINFDHKRSIIAQCDYPVFLTEGAKAIHRLFKTPNNPLPAYKNLVNDGKISLKDRQIHQIKVVSSDFEGNEAILSFAIQKNENANSFLPDEMNFTQTLATDKKNNIDISNQLNAVIDGNTLADSLRVLISVNMSHNSPAAFSGLYTIGEPTEHLMDYFPLKIKLTKQSKAPSKLCIAWKDEKGKWQHKGGKENDGWVEAKVRELGEFYITVDTSAPIVRQHHFSEKQTVPADFVFSFFVTDDFSGIKNYDAYIDGKWVLMEYDAKNDLMKIVPNEKYVIGKHQLRIVVSDEKGNATTKTYNFTVK